MSIEPLNSPSLLGYLWRARRALAPGVGLALLRSLAIAPCPLIFARIIDQSVPAGDTRSVLLYTALFASLLGMHYVFSILGANELAKIMANLMVELRSRIFFRLQFLSFSYLDRQKTGRLLSKYAFDTQKIESLLYSVLNQFLPVILYSTGVFLVLAFLNWRLTTILVLALPVWAFAKWRFFAKLQITNHEARLAQEKLTGTASEFISALRLVRSFGEEKQAEQLLDRSSGDFARSRVDQSWVSAVFGTFTYVSTQAIAALVVAGGAILAIQGQMTIGTLVAFIAGLPVILAPVQMVIGLSEPWFAGRESYASIKELIDSPYVEEWHGARREKRLSGDIVFDRVTFTYPETEKRVIESFSLTIRPGENIALVGPSGSGKSTLANLLLGLYAPTGGQILIDGVPQSEWDMRWIRRQMAVVMQESILLSGTVDENIRFAHAGATDEEVRAAARLANAEEFILKMPQGYQTPIGERGVTLSGGQRQRLAIARAILRNPPVLILDEATSALDYESERLIQQALDRLAHGRTVITIAHRLSTIKNADRIVVLRDGAVLEEGDYPTLLARGGAFAELISAQTIGADFIKAETPSLLPPPSALPPTYS
ncbi:MAG: ABC transporter ATP-binding protein [Opitutaceae bacterium]|jgi:ATP-binding cassette, subfamily B, bacterial